MMYLGHRIVPGGRIAHQAKVTTIMDMTDPKDVSQLRSFIGLCNYYQSYVPDFSILAHSLYALLKKNVSWNWSNTCAIALKSLKSDLTKYLVLKRPDFEKPFILHTDWSAIGIGSILAQQELGQLEYVIAYASRSNNQAKSNYSSYEGECLAVVWSIVYFRPYLYGRRFILVINHQPLKWLMTNDKLS